MFDRSGHAGCGECATGNDSLEDLSPRSRRRNETGKIIECFLVHYLPLSHDSPGALLAQVLENVRPRHPGCMGISNLHEFLRNAIEPLSRNIHEARHDMTWPKRRRSLPWWPPVVHAATPFLHGVPTADRVSPHSSRGGLRLRGWGFGLFVNDPGSWRPAPRPYPCGKKTSGGRAAGSGSPTPRGGGRLGRSIGARAHRGVLPLPGLGCP